MQDYGKLSRNYRCINCLFYLFMYFSILKAPVWVVSATDKANYDVMFRKADLDMDGFVSGQEIRDIFLQSGLQNNILAHIWYCNCSLIGAPVAH